MRPRSTFFERVRPRKAAPEEARLPDLVACGANIGYKPGRNAVPLLKQTFWMEPTGPRVFKSPKSQPGHTHAALLPNRPQIVIASLSDTVFSRQ